MSRRASKQGSGGGLDRSNTHELSDTNNSKKVGFRDASVVVERIDSLDPYDDNGKTKKETIDIRLDINLSKGRKKPKELQVSAVDSVTPKKAATKARGHISSKLSSRSS